MTANISCYKNQSAREKTQGKSGVGDFSQEHSETARGFLRKFPEYQPTPLFSLRCQARNLGVGEVLVKDESYRFGLKAFNHILE